MGHLASLLEERKRPLTIPTRVESDARDSESKRDGAIVPQPAVHRQAGLDVPIHRFEVSLHHGTACEGELRGRPSLP